MKYKWLLFDADGTLFDYDRAEVYALRHTFEQLGCPFSAFFLNEYRRINHAIWLEFEQGQIDQITLRTRRFELLLAAINLKGDSQEFSANYLVNLAQSTFLIDGAEEALKLLAPQFNLAIITNGLADVQRPRFAQSAIAPYIKEIIISEEIGAAKPDPAFFDVAFAQMGCPARSEALVIGDSLSSDIQGGLNYGLDTCWFNPAGQPNGQITCTFEIQQLAELPGLVGLTSKQVNRQN